MPARPQNLIRGLTLATAVAIAMTTLAARAPAAARVASPARPAADTTGPVDRAKRVEARSGVVTSASALASEAGLSMIKAGGNAVDAAVATAFAIGVVEPQMSGLGGSGSALVWMKREAMPAYLDFYAAQPADSWRGHTEPARGAAVPAPGAQEAEAPEPRAVEPGDMRVVAIPGAVAGLLALHEKYGTLPRAQVIAPAIRLAEEGFPIGGVLASFVPAGAKKMAPYPKALALYFPGGRPLAVGETLRNPELAESLRRVAREGAAGFYGGDTAANVLSTLNAGRHPATLADLAAYSPQWKRPLCGDYRGYTVLSAPPPQTGLQVLHTLELLEPFDLKALGLPTRSAAAFDAFASALRVGQAASRVNADPNWALVPANGIISSAFAESRGALVGRRVASSIVEPADASPYDRMRAAGACPAYAPYGPAEPLPAPGPTAPQPDQVDEAAGGETTHLSVVDRHGNAVSLTVTNSEVWGSGGFVGGFFLNNSGYRFTDDDVDVPSRSRWRVRTTTISPTVVLRRGEVRLVIGAPGAGRIPTEIVQVMVYALDYGMDPLDAVRMPRLYTSARHARVQVEHGFAPEVLREARAMGYDPVSESAGYARLYLVARRGSVWVGVADPRHDGEPRGY